MAEIPEKANVETVKGINATIAETITAVEAAEGETKAKVEAAKNATELIEPVQVAKTNATETEDEPEEIVDEVNKLIAADEKKLENGQRVGGDKIALGNDTTDDQEVIVNTSNITGNATGRIQEVVTTLLNGTTEEEDEYLDFTTEAIIVTATERSEPETGSEDSSIDLSDDLPGDQHALTQENSAGIIKTELPAILCIVSLLVYKTIHF